MQPTKYYKQIPVGEELPEYYKVIIVSNENVLGLAWLASDGDNYIWTLHGSDQIVKVTHWLKEVDIKQLCVEFAEWISKECNTCKSDYYYKDGLYYTTSELWDIYIKENNIKQR